MTKWNETPEGEAFIASGDSRETSQRIMEAIAFFARNIEEAEAIWEDGPLRGKVSATDIWENVTNNGMLDAEDFVWGAAGNQWAKYIGAIEE